MIKKSELIFVLIRLATDYILLLLAAITAYFLRFKQEITEIRPVIFDLPFDKYIIAALVVSVVWILFFFISRLYNFKKPTLTDELARIFMACSTGMAAIIIYMFFVRELFESRFIVLAAWILSIVYIVLGRFIIRMIQNHLYKTGWGTNKVVLVGYNAYTQTIKDTINKESSLGLKIIGQIKEIDSTAFDKLVEWHKKYFIDEIIQSDPNISRKDSIKLLNFAKYNHIVFKYAAGPFEARSTNIESHMIGGIPVIEIKKTPLDGWRKIIKRTADIVFSFILLLLLSPILLLTALAIKITSRGPIIYKNERVGQYGNKFFVYKFRSMYNEFSTDENTKAGKKALEYENKLIKEQRASRGALYKIKKDPRVTKVGKFIRKFSIDELPQFFNVLIGNMSLVGPRPHQPREVANYSQEQTRTLDIKPGLTGLAQISGRSDLPFDEEAKMDIYYIENWSYRLDLWIFLKTPWVVLKGLSAI
ncbi:MAG TPA: sugar transferase [Candidatus Bipolaricaulota bacterium]|nr:sugar transferase [Candidatus Bipolaricaulota bacterium]